MAATRSFEDGLIDKLEECFMRFQKCFTLVRQELSLRSDQNKKNTDCFKESVKEDSSKTEGNPTISEEDGTDSLREQGEDDWQPASETDLQNIRDTLDCCNLKPRMDVTREGRARSKPSCCSYGPDSRSDPLWLVFGGGPRVRKMTWDPGIKVIKILKQHLEDKVFLEAGNINNGLEQDEVVHQMLRVSDNRDQFSSSNPSEVLVTSALVRILDGAKLVQKYKDLTLEVNL
ncbi:hypothetical protein Tco_1262000 [Tanacetum coccineum]